MIFNRKLGLCAAAVACVTSSVAAAAAPGIGQAAATPAPAPKPGSNYLQCDGAPNNVTAGETTARLIGAITLLGLFAPPPEAFDASKRKLGAEGVVACTALIDGEKKEGNPARRVQLILGRAIHLIEAKDYTAALDDVKLAEKEAAAAGLTANPYFNRSQGRAFGLIRSAALFRLGRAEEAQAAALAGAAIVHDSATALELLPDYMVFIAHGSRAEEDVLHWRTLNRVLYSRTEAARLEELGKFAEARALRDATMDYNAKMAGDERSSLLIAEAALTHALSGDVKGAIKLGDEARANYDRTVANGKPEALHAEYVEVLDLLNIVTTAQTDMKAARRLFAGRSEWTTASFGCVMEINRRLRAGAVGEELIGSLARTPEQMFADRAAEAKAVLLAADSDNKTLWLLLPRTIGESSYFAASKRVWNTKKSALLIPPEAGKPHPYEIMWIPNVDPVVQRDAIKLHAALLAKSRGQQGFAIVPLYVKDFRGATVFTGNRDEPGLAAPIFNDADAVIADLSEVIPDPAIVEARKSAKR